MTYGVGTGQLNGWAKDRMVELRRLISAASAHCTLSKGAKVRIETTMREIVDVQSVTPAKPLSTCEIEAIWSIPLSESFYRSTSLELTL